MRKITSQASAAFYQKRDFKSANTEVIATSDGSGATLKLHGNTIAVRDKNQLFVTSAGWETSTTKERLNGIQGVRVNQVKGQWYLNGKLWENSSKLTKI